MLAITGIFRSRRYQNKRKFGSNTNHSTQLQQNEIDDGSINGTLEGDDEARAELFKVDDDDADEANSDPDLSWLGYVFKLISEHVKAYTL